MEIDIKINLKELKYEDAKWMSWLRIVTTIDGTPTEESVKHNSKITLKYTLRVATCFGLQEAIFRPSVN
jgi:hypothetical protein